MKRTITSILKVATIIAIPIVIIYFYFMYQGATSKTTAAKQNTVQTDTSMASNQQPAAAASTQQTEAPFPSKEIITGYLQVKNALAKDNGKEAAIAANTIVATLAKVNIKNLPNEQIKHYMDIADDIKENAEHIGANAGKIAHQREHFEILSKDIADLIKTFGNGGQTFYKDFCPMVNDGKGALWVSETKDISNPYLGKSMPTCGTVKEEIK